MFNLWQDVFMDKAQATEKPRQRAPSKRALATRARVFDAAEKVFADRGFDGATIRMIATEAGEPVGTIHHHGGGKDVLFQQTVARRAATLSQARLEALARLESPATMAAVLEAFIRPFFDLALQDPRWRNYARLVAFVSVDDRWRDLSAECFDPTAEVFLAEIKRLAPHATPQQTAEGFVFTVAAMLALLTSQGRISDLAGSSQAQAAQIDHLVAFCAAGFVA
jgi:AcrR family transcriptional regulator